MVPLGLAKKGRTKRFKILPFTFEMLLHLLVSNLLERAFTSSIMEVSNRVCICPFQSTPRSSNQRNITSMMYLKSHPKLCSTGNTDWTVRYVSIGTCDNETCSLRPTLYRYQTCVGTNMQIYRKQHVHQTSKCINTTASERNSNLWKRGRI